MTNEELYYLPASELLKHIQAEKERLIKEKAIKKSKPLPPITEEEKPYELPEDWEWVRLGEIGDWGAGATPLRSRSDYYSNGSVPWLKTGELNDGYITKCEEYITELALKETSVRFNKPGDILIAMYGATIGKLGILKIAATTNQACCACSVFRGINNKFLFYFLLAMRENFKGMSEGGAQPNISKDKISKTIFPLPPLYIQDQIVQKLEQLSEAKDSLLSHAKSQLNYTKKMRESLLQEAIRGELVPQDENDEPASILLEKIKAEKVRLIKEKVIKKQKELPPITDEEKPYDLPEGWEWVRLGEVGITQTGTTPSTKNKDYFNGKIPFIKPADISSTGINYKNESVTEEGANVGRTTSENSILMVCIGGSIGKTYYTDRMVSFNQQINAIECYPSIQFKYVQYTLMSNYFYGQVRLRATGTATPIINKSTWDNILIPLPPLAEQERIVAKLDELMATCDLLEAKAEEMKNYTTRLFEANLKEAFMPE